ncbi:DUF1801 domain-containing protein [Arthrobacter sp. H35-D1]|uniref:DUF1801 domain-containing protein n=1 Tax=Arthrobacter sp. H35-D1 TaxID=3046202 RepID=UPI0024B9ED35|nr:DUF1801 domain-containing protein [Arthrobacter sp. H35-D1]MDJ0312019.1 DUF1801 domain-containing protein [Arthrobacter sp. H35-D1]
MAKDPLPGSTSKGGNKTSAAEAEPVDFINSVDTTATRRADAHPLPALMQETTGQPPRRWDPSIIGFGSYHYTYASGCEGDAAAAGFSPRKANLVIYGLTDTSGSAELLKKLGHFRSGGIMHIPQQACGH